MENELDKLRVMLREAKIPFETFQESMEVTDEKARKYAIVRYGEAYIWRRNQIIYGRHFEGDYEWLFDGVCQYGSYAAKTGMIEAWGKLGQDESGYPRTMTAREAFEIIKADWERRQEKNEENTDAV